MLRTHIFPKNRYVANNIICRVKKFIFYCELKSLFFLLKKAHALRRVEPQPATPRHTSVDHRFVNKRLGSEFVERSTVQRLYVPHKDK